jgi:hypothetical protein
MRGISGRPILKICTIHSVSYCKEPARVVTPEWEDGFCDVCEMTGQPNVPQSITDPTTFSGLRPELTEEITEPEP